VFGGASRHLPLFVIFWGPSPRPHAVGFAPGPLVVLVRWRRTTSCVGDVANFGSASCGLSTVSCFLDTTNISAPRKRSFISPGGQHEHRNLSRGLGLESAGQQEPPATNFGHSSHGRCRPAPPPVP